MKKIFPIIIIIAAIVVAYMYITKEEDNSHDLYAFEILISQKQNESLLKEAAITQDGIVIIEYQDGIEGQPQNFSLSEESKQRIIQLLDSGLYDYLDREYVDTSADDGITTDFSILYEGEIKKVHVYNYQVPILLDILESINTNLGDDYIEYTYVLPGTPEPVEDTEVLADDSSARTRFDLKQDEYVSYFDIEVVIERITDDGEVVIEVSEFGGGSSVEATISADNEVFEYITGFGTVYTVRFVEVKGDVVTISFI